MKERNIYTTGVISLTPSDKGKVVQLMKERSYVNCKMNNIKAKLLLDTEVLVSLICNKWLRNNLPNAKMNKAEKLLDTYNNLKVQWEIRKRYLSLDGQN